MENKSETNKCAKKSCDAETSRSPKASQGTTKKKYWNETLEHAGPAFPAYEKLPENVHFKYKANYKKLSPEAEEGAVLYARKLMDSEEEEIPIEENFKKTFMVSWREVMEPEEMEEIVDIDECDFKEIIEYLKDEDDNEESVGRKKAQDKILKDKHGHCFIDGTEYKLRTYKVEQPSILPNGKLKKRVWPKNVIINYAGKRPEPPEGCNWGGEEHDNTARWVAKWKDEVQKKFKFIYLDDSAGPKQNDERDKYETARELHKYISTIQDNYRTDWESKHLKIRERGVAIYLLDNLALRPGSEKYTESTGLCSLKVGHIKLLDNNTVEFDFMGKSSVQYDNRVPVHKTVYRNFELFIKKPKQKVIDLVTEQATAGDAVIDSLASGIAGLNVTDGDDTLKEQPVGKPMYYNPELFGKTYIDKKADEPLFDHLNTSKLNYYFKKLMPNLTAKVFRTYRACVKFEEQLKKLTHEDGEKKENAKETVKEAEAEVAKLCNHKKNKQSPNKTKPKEEKVLNLISSLENYIDPRIVIAWCKRNGVDIDKGIYSKTQRERFQWAIKEIENLFNNGQDFIFCN